jgi:type VI secretion system secreted protein VgrG
MDETLSLAFETTSATVDPHSVRVLRVRGVEAVSRCYECEVDVLVDVDGGWPVDVLEDLLKRPCRVSYGPLEGPAFVHGALRSIRMLSTATPQPVVYRLTLGPRLALAADTRRSRVFQELDVAGIARLVLGELRLVEGEDFELALSKSYPVSEYTVQYQESDLAFLERQLEHHGIFYFFTQTEARERLVIADSNAAFAPTEDHPQIDYTPGEAAALPGVTSLTYELTPRPAVVVLREYNWRTPSVALQSEAPADARTGRGFLNEYGQHFKNPAEGAALAAARAEELVVSRQVFEGSCRVASLAPGHHFELVGHPLADLDQAYVVTSVEHELSSAVEGAGSQGLLKRFRAIPLTVPFRPARTAPKPRIDGIMHALVDGDVPGTAAPIDERGRYKVLFPFDLAGRPGGRASRWVRLGQPSSGPGYGIHFPLHIGVEVIVSHVDGDPDRPVILGSPPNAETVTPVSARNPTQSEIVTKTGIRMTWDDDA